MILAPLAGYQFAHYNAINLILFCASIGLCAFAFSVISFRRETLSGQQILFLTIVVLFFLTSLLSYALHPGELATYRVKRFALMTLFGIGPLLFIQQFVARGITLRQFSIALAISTIVTGPVSLYMYYYVDDNWRVSIGPNYPTIFGDIICLNALLCFYLALNERNSLGLRLALWLGIGCALLGAFASGARGAWLGLVVLAPLVVAVQTRATIKARLLMLLLLGLGVVAVFYGNDTISMRIGLLLQDIRDYFVHDNPFSSNGRRIEFWKASLLSIQQHPWLGIGDQVLGEAFAGFIANGLVTETIAPYMHVHNDLLQLAYSKGIPGIVVYFALIAMPPLVVAPQWRFPALIVSLSYFVFGMSDCLFIIEMSIAYYFFLTVILMNLRSDDEEGAIHKRLES